MKKEYAMLIADDEPAARTYALSQIDWKRLAITSLYEADNGRDALKIILEKRPDIMILDIRMPEMDGVELLEELCQRKIEISVIGLSGYSDFDAARKMLSSGKVVEYLLKPVSADALFEAVTKCQEKLLQMEQLRLGQEQARALFAEDEGDLENLIMEVPPDTKVLPDVEEMPPKISGRRSAIVQMAKEYIEVHYSRRLSLEEIAAHVYINPSYLSRLFAEEGMGVQKYIQKVRIEKAKVLLRDPRYKVYEVGDMVGYTNFHHFLKIFRKWENITPSQYRDHAQWLTEPQNVKK